MESTLRKLVVRVLFLLFAALPSLAVLSGATMAQAATITVQNLDDDGPGSLRQAVRDAKAGDTVDFDSDVRGVIVLTSGVIEITKSLTILGPEARELAIDGNANSSIFYNFANGVTISGLTLFNARGQEAIGAIYNGGQLTLREVSIAGNRSVSSDGTSFGGGIVNGSGNSLTILNSAIYDNTATLGGGIANAGTLNIANSTLAINLAFSLDLNATGGAIYNAGGQMRLTGVTVAENRSLSFFGVDYGGGISNFGRASIANSIFDSNSATFGADLFGRFTSLDYNLISDTATESELIIDGTATHDILDEDARLDVLGFYGGPTPTYALRVGSPALDAGRSFGLTSDQRTEKRPFNRTDIANATGSDGSDIGAFEDNGPVDIPQNSNTLVVNRADNRDDGTCTTRDCSLREAINAANQRTGARTITFNLSDVQGTEISVFPPLPVIVNAVTIDGTTQPGFQGRPLIQIRGRGDGEGLLVIHGNGNRIKGLSLSESESSAIFIGGNGNTIEGCALIGNVYGIQIRNGSNNIIGGITPPPPGSAISPSTNVISGNRTGVAISGISQGNALMTNAIGTTPDGQNALPNQIAGVIIDGIGGAGGNLIGVPTGVPGFGGNLISGNHGPGVWLSFNTKGNSVQNNIIGTNFVPQLGTATKALPNGIAGILIEDSSNNSIGGQPHNGSFASQVVSGNNGDGILIRSRGVYPTTGNTVSNNEVGLVDKSDDPGQAALVISIPNTGAGIHVINAPGNIIGSTSTASAVPTNRIGFNGGSGILIEGARAIGNTVDLNFVGIIEGPQQKFSAPNGKDGIEVINAPGTIIGGVALNKLHNTIANNKGNGISISGATARGSRILGNSIGSDFFVTVPMPNGGSGIRLDGAANTRIGGIGIEPNFIAYNIKNGIEIVGNAAVGNSIRNNCIFQNRQQGIDLGADGLTGNDTRDADTGPNRRQNYPVITSVVGNTRSQISGTLSSLPNQTYAIDLFSAASGRSVQAPNTGRYIASVTVTTNAQGTAAFAIATTERLGSRFVTASATNVSTGDTSEFAPSKRAVVDQTAPNISSVNVQSLFGIGGVTITVTAHDAQGIDNVRLRFKRRTTKGGAVVNTFETKTAFVRNLPDGAAVYELKTKGLAPGFYTVEAIVEDGLGNTSTSSGKEFFVLINNLGNLFN